MLDFVLHRAKFLGLVKDNAIIPSLKSFSDTLLFYYIGHMAMTRSQGDLFEIGVGGSTYPMLDLSSLHQRPFTVVDMDRTRLMDYTNKNLFPESVTQTHAVSSLQLVNLELDNLCYCHLDGSKDYKIALNDLEYCTKNLSINGLICQDDYGNNKWPTVSDATQHMISTGQLVMLIVGDSSAWLTRPEYYDHWMEFFSTDKEFTHLAQFVNMQSSKNLHKLPNYFYMQSPTPGFDLPVAEDDVIDYYNQLLDFDHADYLQMPYRDQSMPGVQFRTTRAYRLQVHWKDFAGDTWPQLPPVTRQDIDNLPDWIKSELSNLHQITDLYEKMHVLKDTCVKHTQVD
jgi:hypothetical protein